MLLQKVHFDLNCLDGIKSGLGADTCRVHRQYLPQRWDFKYTYSFGQNNGIS
jgi:hypothetical protein